MIRVKMSDPLRITLRYKGPAVEDGTMPIDDAVAALRGFAGAYGKVASKMTPEVYHNLRVASVREGSWELALVSIVVLGQTPNAEHLLQIGIDAGKLVVCTIVKLIRAKKHMKGQEPTVEINGNHNIVLINTEGSRMEIPPDVYEIYQSGEVDGDLNRITRPLEPCLDVEAHIP